MNLLCIYCMVFRKFAHCINEHHYMVSATSVVFFFNTIIMFRVLWRDKMQRKCLPNDVNCVTDQTSDTTIAAKCSQQIFGALNFCSNMSASQKNRRQNVAVENYITAEQKEIHFSTRIFNILVLIFSLGTQCSRTIVCFRISRTRGDIEP